MTVRGRSGVTSGSARPSQCSARRRSPPSPPSLEKRRHRPDGTTGCSCHHTGPSPPGHKEQGDGAFRGKRDSKLGGPAARHPGRPPLTAAVPALGALARQPSRARGAGPPAKATAAKPSFEPRLPGAQTAPPCGEQRALQRHPQPRTGLWTLEEQEEEERGEREFLQGRKKTGAPAGREGGEQPLRSAQSGRQRAQRSGPARGAPESGDVRPPRPESH